MAWYDYKCENEHSYSDNRSIYEEEKADMVCPLCSAKLTRIYSAPPITFKGNGFNAKSG